MNKDKSKVINPSDLLGCMFVNVKEDMKDFDDYLNLYDAVNREIFIGEIEGGVGISVNAYIRYWNEQDEKDHIPVEERKPIKLYIDSPGGSLSETFTIIDSIRLSRTPVHGICIGTAYSGGFFILIACHKRIGYRHSSYLFHEGSTATEGTSGQFENYTEFYKRQLRQLRGVVIYYTNITEEEYDKIKKDDIWYDAKQALEAGIIDEIAGGFDEI